jgi:hypothetical protein
LTVTSGLAVWKAAIQVVCATDMEEAPLPVRRPLRPEAVAPPVVAGAAASFAAQPLKASTEAATRASGATSFFENMCDSSRASVSDRCRAARGLVVLPISLVTVGSDRDEIPPGR